MVGARWLNILMNRMDPDLFRACFEGWVRERWPDAPGQIALDGKVSRVRKGHGARNMAVVRHFAINLVREAKDKKSIKTRRKRASWNPEYLASLIDPLR